MDAALPTLFISHGGPTILVDRTPAHAFLACLGGSLPRPRAILSISAHWLEPGATVSGAAWPE
ncbi:MAG: dioxygenase, partial [Rhodospirillales bacterium]|nr:dioxygenase [Rhodospirillales bacterium]